MEFYTNDNRGTIQNAKRAKQLIRFDGLRYNNITPTDLDFFAEYHNQAFIFAEFKHGSADVPFGQKLALMRITDRIQQSGAEAVLFVCEHYVGDPNEDVYAAESIVRKIYYKQQIYRGDGKTLKELWNRFLDYATKKEVNI